MQMARKQVVCLRVWMHCSVCTYMCVCMCAWVTSHWPRTTGHPVSMLLRSTDVGRRRKWWRQASQTRSIACKICYEKNAANVMCCYCSCCCCWWLLLLLLTAHVQQQTVPNKWPSAFSCSAASCTWSAKLIHLFVLFVHSFYFNYIANKKYSNGNRNANGKLFASPRNSGGKSRTCCILMCARVKANQAHVHRRAARVKGSAAQQEVGEERRNAYTTFDRFNTNEAVKCFA